MSCNNLRRLSALAIFGAALSVSGMAHAQSITDVLSQTQSQTAVIHAQIEQAKAKAELQTVNNNIAKLKAEANGEPLPATAASPTGAGGATPTPAARAAAKVEEEAPPQVMAIFGANKVLFASLRYPSGVQMDVSQGDRIDGDFTVKTITSNRVTLTRKGVEYVLRIYSGSNTAAAQAAKAETAAPALTPFPSIGSQLGLPPMTTPIPMGNAPAR